MRGEAAHHVAQREHAKRAEQQDDGDEQHACTDDDKAQKAYADAPQRRIGRKRDQVCDDLGLSVFGAADLSPVDGDGVVPDAGGFASPEAAGLSLVEAAESFFTARAP